MGNAPSTSSPASLPSSTSPSLASACPVDPAARQVYLEAAAAASASTPSPQTRNPNPPINPRPSEFLYGVPTSFASTSCPKQQQAQQLRQQDHHSSLPSSRVTSTIPRAPTSPSTVTPSPTSPQTDSSPNAQTAHPTTSSDGNWIYPSEKMFFDALRRKQHSPHAADMSAVVPIHNAVNERAWKLIKDWEMRYAKGENEGCGGPRLRSFSGDSGKVSPRARWLGWWGYERPFDRHDWVVERCPMVVERGEGKGKGKGEEVEYVIDFYRGRESERGGGVPGGLNFYLDVRPKLNRWEGWRMRMWRFWGL